MNKNVVYIIGLLMMVTSCSDFLEPKSQSEFVPKNAVSLNEMLLGDAYPQPNVSSCYLFSLQTMLDDDICCSSLPYTAYQVAQLPGYNALYSWQPDMFYLMGEVNIFYNVWESYYQFILGANAALDYIDDMVGTYEEKAIVKAQSYALRALYYFNLVNLFGEPYNHNKKALGVPLKISSELTSTLPARNTVEEVYTQIETDLNEAEKFYLSLPESSQFSKNYRTSLPMVQLLKSRVYLHMERWSEAAEYADKVISDWSFSLVDLNTLPAPTAKEPYYNFISFDCSETIWLYGSVDDVTKYNRFIIGGQDKQPRWYMFNASTDLLTGYVGGDLRKERYIVKEYSDPTIYLTFGKYLISSTHVPSSGTEFGVAFRLAEAYLNLAEGAALSNDPVTARAAINTLREHRFTPETYTPMPELTGQDLVDYIRQERRLELCYEGFRWFDLRRYGMPSFSRDWVVNGEKVATYVIAEKDPSYTLPIPEQVLEKNKNLEQNTLANPR